MSYFLTILCLCSSILAFGNSVKSRASQSADRGPASNTLGSSIAFPGYYNCEYNNQSYLKCDANGVPVPGSSPQTNLNQYINDNPAALQNQNDEDSRRRLDILIADCQQTSGMSSVECERSMGLNQGTSTSTGNNGANRVNDCVANESYPGECDIGQPTARGEVKGTNNGTCQHGMDALGNCRPNPNDPNAAVGPSPTAPSGNLNLAGYEAQQQHIEVCAAAGKKADDACNPEAQSWMKAINQVSGILGSTMNQGACSTLAATQTGSAASMSYYTAQCGQAVGECVSTCQKNIVSSDPNIKNEATEIVKECNKKGVTAKQAEQAAAQGAAQLAKAIQSCQASFGMDMGNMGIQAQPYVGKTADEILAGLQTQQDQSLNFQGTGSGQTGDMNANINLDDLGSEAPTIGPAKPRSVGQAPGGQQGSAGMGSGGGVGVDANSGRASNRKSGSGLFSNILSGFFGSGGGGSFGGSGGSGRSGSGGGSWFGGGSGSNQPQAAKMPDLRQFLPGAKLDPKKDRGIAGRVVSRDGISGPHSNVWRDISNRYQVKKASLLP